MKPTNPDACEPKGYKCADHQDPDAPTQPTQSTQPTDAPGWCCEARRKLGVARGALLAARVELEGDAVRAEEVALLTDVLEATAMEMPCDHGAKEGFPWAELAALRTVEGAALAYVPYPAKSFDDRLMPTREALIHALAGVLEARVVPWGTAPAAWPNMPAWSCANHDDTPLREDAMIDAAFPTRSERHDLYGEAMRLVGARRSKAGLVALVTWLLLGKDELKAEVQRKAAGERRERSANLSALTRIETLEKELGVRPTESLPLWLRKGAVVVSTVEPTKGIRFVVLDVNEFVAFKVQGASSRHEGRDLISAVTFVKQFALAEGAPNTEEA